MPNASKEFKPLSTNSLMAHLRNECGISIGGSTEKRKLQNIGYYHGYKGYRFAKSERNRLPITDFSELYRLYLFDNRLKAPSILGLCVPKRRLRTAYWNPYARRRPVKI